MSRADLPAALGLIFGYLLEFELNNAGYPFSVPALPKLHWAHNDNDARHFQTIN